MTSQEIKDNEDYIVCWSCDGTVNIGDLSSNDGFCPICNQEIDRNESN